MTEAIVIAARSGGGPVVLHAVCTGTGGGEEELVALLRSRLPQYMVPRSIVFWPEFPLNSNGKVDRNAIRSEIAGE
ncbi:hypothetical protein GCM10020000_79850 [Streptomyces olivoverticillatus]